MIESATPTGTAKYLLVSGSRDRLTQIYEITNSGSVENIAILDDHSSTITSVKMALEKGQKGWNRLKLITCGADKQIVMRNLNLNIIANSTVKELSDMNSEEFITVQKKEQCKNKIFAMDIAYQASYVITGHDKLLQLWSMSTGDKVWEKKPDSVRKIGSMDQLKVYIDDLASIVISSSTDKYVSIYEGATGQLISRFTCGEITTAMCMSSNLKHLITTSSDGIIYIWKLPEALSKAL